MKKIVLKNAHLTTDLWLTQQLLKKVLQDLQTLAKILLWKENTSAWHKFRKITRPVQKDVYCIIFPF